MTHLRMTTLALALLAAPAAAEDYRFIMTVGPTDDGFISRFIDPAHRPCFSDPAEWRADLIGRGMFEDLTPLGVGTNPATGETVNVIYAVDMTGYAEGGAIPEAEVWATIVGDPDSEMCLHAIVSHIGVGL